MSSYTVAITALLKLNAPLVAIITGGIYAEEDLGPDGLTKTSAPAAVWSAGYLKPVIRVKERTDQPWGGINDTQNQTSSFQKMIEIWFYDDGPKGYGTIELAQSMVYALLHMKLVNKSRLRNSFNVPDLRDAELNNAAVIRADYAAILVKSSGG